MVRATFAGFSTALSAIQANQKRLDITGQNLANMNTVGYTRQTLKTSSVNYTHPVSHYANGSEVVVGFGVHMDAVTQIRDPYLDIQYRNQIQKSGYTDAMQQSLDRLADIFDESEIMGIRYAFDDIQAALTSIHDLGKVNDPIYEAELRSRMKSLTNLLNDASRQIDEAEKNEYARLDGTNVNELGAVQNVNDILMQIGNLNRQIKTNQIAGQPSLELMDERNVLLDELASYIPIEVSYYKDAAHQGFEYDGKGNALFRKEWPDDLKVEMLYKDETGATQRLTLVDGTEGVGKDNYSQLKIEAKMVDPDDPTKTKDYDGTQPIIPDSVKITFTEAKSVTDRNAAANPGTRAKTVEISSANLAGSGAGGTKTYFEEDSGSIQASLDMLWQDGKTAGLNKVKGYEYYRDQLDNLAKAFAGVMNKINIDGANYDATSGKNKKQFLLVDRNASDMTSSDAWKNITAANIGINTEWINGNVKLSTTSKPDGNANDTVLNMLEAMTATYPYKNIKLGAINNTDGIENLDYDLKNNSFSDFMNYTSTVLANETAQNTRALKTNVTVLNGIQESRDSISGVSLDEEASNMMMYMSAYGAASRLMTTLDEALSILINNTGVVGR